jgi:hypothetical protein
MKEPSMKKPGLMLSSILFCFFFVLTASAFAHEDELHDAYEEGSALHQKLEEGSGSSAVESGMEKAEEYKSGHEEAEEEGSFSYKRHRKEMNAKKKAMQENMHNPAGAAGKMEEGSGKK